MLDPDVLDRLDLRSHDILDSGTPYLTYFLTLPFCFPLLPYRMSHALFSLLSDTSSTLAPISLAPYYIIVIVSLPSKTSINRACKLTNLVTGVRRRSINVLG